MVIPTFEVSQGIVLEIYQSYSNQNFIASYLDEVSEYTHTIRADGGFDSMNVKLQLSQRHIDDWIESGLGRKVIAKSSGGIIIWEGMVNNVTTIIFNCLFDVRVFIQSLPLAFLFLPAHRNEKRVSWLSYAPALDQFVSSSLTKGLYPKDELKRNLDDMLRNAEIAESYGLKPGFVCYEPRCVNEKIFDKHPHLRGAEPDPAMGQMAPRG